MEGSGVMNGAVTANTIDTKISVMSSVRKNLNT